MKEKVEISYTYDTPTGIVEKEGIMVRGMTDDVNRPVWARVLIIFFSTILFILPGLFLLYTGLSFLIGLFTNKVSITEAYTLILPLGLGILLLVGGIKAVLLNIKKRL